MATFTVTTAADVVDGGDGVLSLREAVSQANATGAADTILFASALEGQTLTLTQGQLNLASDVAIDGDRNDDGSGITLSGGDASRVVGVNGTGAGVTLADLVIRDGLAETALGGGINLVGDNSLVLDGCTVRDNVASSDSSESAAGGIFAGAGSRLVVTGSTISGNEAASFNFCGGILASGAEVSISRSVIENNAGYGGGGLALTDNSYLLLDRSIVRDNTGAHYKGGYGGGIYASQSRLVLSASTISGNFARYDGGGVYLKDAEAAIDRCTIADNSSRDFYGYGATGGIAANGTSLLSLTNSTVTGNTSGEFSGGPGGIEVGSAARMFIANSIVAGNFGTYAGDPVARDFFSAGTVASNGHNIFGAVSTASGASAVLAPGDLANIAPALLFAALDPDSGGGLLALNGGSTPTVALRDALTNPALSGADPVTGGDLDQRGFARPNPAASNPDIGAFELAQSAISRSPSPGNDVLTGSAAADTLNGFAGADLLLGQGGNDRLLGGAGGDSLRGGFGDDTLDGGAGQDTASYRDASARVVANLDDRRSSGALGVDTLFAIENLEGGSGADRLTGDAAANALAGLLGDDALSGLDGQDRLYGQGGDDWLEGGFGSDWLDGGAGIDGIFYTNDGGPLGVTVDLVAGRVTRGTEVDRLRSIEWVEGTNLADVITGNGEANRLDGAYGADTIRGLGGDDVLVGGFRNDVLDGDAGRDLVDYTFGGAVVVDLSQATDIATRGAEIDTLREIEGAIGSAQADTLIGDAAANLFRGAGNKDVQTGGAGADTFDYDALSDSQVGANRDRITDFAHLADKLDLSTIDARSATAGVNDTFTFLAAKGAAFTDAGQVRWYESGGNTVVEANVDANLAPDLQIQLDGIKTLTGVDFVL